MNWELGLEGGDLASVVVKFEGILGAVRKSGGTGIWWVSLAFFSHRIL